MSTVSAVLDVDSEVPTVSKHTGTATRTVVAAVATATAPGTAAAAAAAARPKRESLTLAMVNQCTKFEVSRFTRYKAMNGGTKCRKWGGLGQLGVTQGQPQSIERIRLPIRL